MSTPEHKVVRITLNRLFGERFVEGVISHAELPEDVSEHTVLISGRDALTVTRGAAHELLRLLDLRHPKDIISTQLSAEAQNTFLQASFDLNLATDYAYLPYEDIPSNFLRPS